ncbi:MAG: hypothetical protein IT340_17190 [Chloroflexi bacterium]|nr:hypothetical protein [Chloroflexota bacterium]
MTTTIDPHRLTMTRDEAEALADELVLEGFHRSIFISLALGGPGDLIEVTEAPDERGGARQPEPEPEPEPGAG